MENYYSSECNIQIVIALLKAYGIRKVIASPGATNLSFVASIQQDTWFDVYSSVDERSAAYIACGMAEESGEPVVLSCTGATASRNYMPGLTEAFYRKLPVLAITSSQDISKIGHLSAQMLDRRSFPNDIVRYGIHLPIVKDDNDLWECEIKVNQALSELKRHGGGPVHINLTTTYGCDYSVKTLPLVRVIRRIYSDDVFPDIPQGKIGVFVGSHRKWGQKQTDALDRFCATNNAVVFCDHTSAYKGKYRVLYSLVASQDALQVDMNNLDLLIHIGEISGEYGCLRELTAKNVWRVNEDGEMRDFFRRLEYVFEMPEQVFFEHYAQKGTKAFDEYLLRCQAMYQKLYNAVPELPFSNLWIAKQIAMKLPENSVLHLGILNSLRSWNFFEVPTSVSAYSNVGGFGIDGGVSSLIGASWVDKKRIYFGVFGDLAFFYDMNVLGNRHVGNNVRLLLINNGAGVEFKNYNHLGALFGDEADKYIAAAGHYGNKSRNLVRHYAEDLGFEYLSAGNKDEFLQVYESFLTPAYTPKPILFEIFTDTKDESDALKLIRNISKDVKSTIVNTAKQLLGPNIKKVIKGIVK